jgi:hypothetical protein
MAGVISSAAHAPPAGQRAGSSRARWRDRVWPPPHWRDLQRRPLPRIDPATRCSSTWPLERIRRAAPICYLQRDVFIKRSGLDCIPAIVHPRRSHCAFSQSERWRQYLPRGLQSKTGRMITSAPLGVAPSLAIQVLDLNPVLRRARARGRRDPLRHAAPQGRMM